MKPVAKFMLVFIWQFHSKELLSEIYFFTMLVDLFGKGGNKGTLFHEIIRASKGFEIFIDLFKPVDATREDNHKESNYS